MRGADAKGQFYVVVICKEKGGSFSGAAHGFLGSFDQDSVQCGSASFRVVYASHGFPFAGDPRHCEGEMCLYHRRG